MADKDQVKQFLSNFNTKKKIFGIVFQSHRAKNTQALLDLEIIPSDRERIIESLIYTDYSEGPLSDVLYKKSDMWVFGKKVKGQEVYIKITMGLESDSTICISFHIAEYEMNYPFKTETL